jgi:hypothetical protein
MLIQYHTEAALVIDKMDGLGRVDDGAMRAGYTGGTP